MIRVNGPARVWVAKTGFPLQRLGTTLGGVTVAHNFNYSPVIIDDGGESAPYDEQYMSGQVAISGQFARYDDAIMEGVRAHIPGREGGLIPDADIGAPILTNGLYFRLYIEATARTVGLVEKPWYFPCVRPGPNMSVTLGTKFNVAPMEFIAHRLNGVLYTRSVTT